jgi:hypothetical protein
MSKLLDELKAVQKISAATALMSEILKHQAPIKSAQEPSWMRPIKKFGLSTQCDVHGNCLTFIESDKVTVSARYPGCVARSFIINRVGFFFVYQELSELSRWLGHARTECAAWTQAAEILSA